MGKKVTRRTGGVKEGLERLLVANGRGDDSFREPVGASRLLLEEVTERIDQRGDDSSVIHLGVIDIKVRV